MTGAAAQASVVISTFEEGDRLAETVDSVLAASVVPQEIVIVDDGSTDAGCDRVWPSAVHVVHQDHLGIAPARNHGALVATQPALVFLDAHCTVQRDWLRPLLGALDHAPDALVGPAVRDEREPRYVGCGAELVDALFTYRWLPVTGAGLVEVGLVPGGCMAVQRDLFLHAGGFAPFSGFGVEDVELALRWWRAGRPLLGTPESVITHRFRANPGYRPDHQAWLQNVLRTALVHLVSDDLRACVLACAPLSSFASAMATVLAEPWIATYQRVLHAEARTVADYIDRWAPRAFGRKARNRSEPVTGHP